MTAQSPAFALQNSALHGAALFRQAVASHLFYGGALNGTDLQVTAQGTPSMSVVVAAGRAWILGTQVGNATGAAWSTQAMYYGLNDAPLSVTIAAADPTNPRIDVVYAAVQDSFYSGANNALVISVQTGTPAASPAVPALPANAIPLANIAVGATATSIASGNIDPTPLTQVVPRGAPLVVSSTGRPTNTRPGQFIFESDTGREYVWSGSAWVYTGGGTNPNAWVDVSGSLGSGYTAGTEGTRYRLNSAKDQVFFQFHINRSSGTKTGVVYTFPSGLRPSFTHWWLPESGGVVVGEIRLTADGLFNLTFTPSAATSMVVAGSFPI